MIKNQQMKRPNTIANKNLHGQVSLKLNLEGKDAPFSSGSMGVGGLGNERQNDKQVNQKNMNEIYDMLQKYAGEEEGKPPVISKESITFNGKNHNSVNNSPNH